MYPDAQEENSKERERKHVVQSDLVTVQSVLESALKN
jgi:hypothetical protein